MASNTERGDLIIPAAVADRLIDAAAEIVEEAEHSSEASYIFRVLHWYRSPDCRENHPSWNPEEIIHGK